MLKLIAILLIFVLVAFVAYILALNIQAARYIDEAHSLTASSATKSEEFDGKY